MSEPARNRFAIDLDDLERQLRGAAQPQKPGAGVDPLMELTRLVERDDPLKDLFAGRPGQPQRPTARFEQAQPAPVHPVHLQPVPVQAAPPPPEMRGALDEFEALLRRSEPQRPAAQPAPLPPQDHYDEPAYEPEPRYETPVESRQHAYVPEDDYAPRSAQDLDQPMHGYHQPAYEDHAGHAGHDEQFAGAASAAAMAGQAQVQAPAYAEPPRSRRGIWTAAALVAVAVIGVGAALALRSGGSSTGTNGQPPVIKASDEPTKIAPVNPGGTEIPNQNKQIYERAGAGAGEETKVVSREEQPVDVQQAARMMPPRPGSQASDTTSGALSASEPGLVAVPPVPGLGEPRRVRTVTIRPDGTPVLPGGQAAAPARPAASAPAAPQMAAAPQSPAMVTGSAPAPARPAATPPRSESATPAATTPAPTRTASLDPAPAAAAAAPRTVAGGGFVVQLAAPGSEAEARATFAALQRKYPQQLGGQSPIVRRTELAGGKTVFRLRVGPYSREDAASMCSGLQAAGGQCFIAKN